jgi:hypothetical protein
MSDYGLEVFDAAGASVFESDYGTWLVVEVADVIVGQGNVVFDKSLHLMFEQFTVMVGTRSARTRSPDEKGLTWEDLGATISVDNSGIAIPWYYMILGK